MPAQQQETAVMERNSRFERAGRGVHVPFFVAGPGARDAAPADGATGLAPGDDAPRPMPAWRTWAIVAAALLAGVGHRRRRVVPQRHAGRGAVERRVLACARPGDD